MKQVDLLHGIEMIPTPHDPIPKAPAREVWNPRGPSVHHSSYDPVNAHHGSSWNFGTWMKGISESQSGDMWESGSYRSFLQYQDTK